MMLGEIDTFEYSLALRLGMTVEEMRQRMSNAEYVQWKAYFTWQNAMQEMDT
jgi:hypothetical protein